jgi:hypothetical protein
MIKPTLARLIGLHDISRIAIGTAVAELEGGPKNVADAWAFFRSELAQHDDDVAIAIWRADGECFGSILCKWQIPETLEKFELFLIGQGFYGQTNSE